MAAARPDRGRDRRPAALPPRQRARLGGRRAAAARGGRDGHPGRRLLRAGGQLRHGAGALRGLGRDRRDPPAARACARNPGAVVLADGMSLPASSSTTSRTSRRCISPSCSPLDPGVNPRHRRLVIPVALAGLILIVVIAREPDWRNERAAVARPDPDARSDPRRRRPGRAVARAPEWPPPPWRRVELRYVDLKAGRHLQVTAYDDTQAHTPTTPVTRPRRRSTTCSTQPFANWHVETTTADPPAAGHQEARGDGAHHRPGRRGRARPRPRPGQGPAAGRGRPGARSRSALTTAQGRVKPSRQAKYRQVEEFLRDARRRDHRRARRAAPAHAHRRATRCGSSTSGCGNAYLTFAAQRFLTPAVRGLPVRLTGVDVKRAVAASTTREVAARARRRRPGHFVGRHRSPAPSSTSRPTSCSPCTPATPPPTTRWPGRSSGRRRWCSPRRAATTTSPRSCASTPTPAPYAMLTRHGILRERFADTLTDALRASLLRLAGYRVDVVRVRREPAHPAQHAAARGAHRLAGQGRRRAQGVRRPRRARGGSSPGSRSWSALADRRVRVLAGIVALLAGRAHGTCVGRRRGVPVPGPATSPSPAGWSIDGGLVVTTNDSAVTAAGSSRSTRAPAAPSGVTDWADAPRDVEALAPAGPGEVWVADIGDNDAERGAVEVTRVPVGRGERRVDAATYRAHLPRRRRRRRDAARRPARPDGSTSSPRGLRRHGVRRSGRADRRTAPTCSQPIGTGPGFATDGAFFPDGRHLVIRSYGDAVVYTVARADPGRGVRPPGAGAGGGAGCRGRWFAVAQLGGRACTRAAP